MLRRSLGGERAHAGDDVTAGGSWSLRTWSREVGVEFGAQTVECADQSESLHERFAGPCAQIDVGDAGIRLPGEQALNLGFADAVYVAQ